MKLAIVISSEAETDIDEGFLWYEFQLIGLGERFVFYVDKGFDSIADMPESFPEIFENVRRHVTKKFPYNIYYRFNKDKSQVEIIRVLHHKQQQKIY